MWPGVGVTSNLTVMGSGVLATRYIEGGEGICMAVCACIYVCLYLYIIIGNSTSQIIHKTMLRSLDSDVSTFITLLTSLPVTNSCMPFMCIKTPAAACQFL